MSQFDDAGALLQSSSFTTYSQLDGAVPSSGLVQFGLEVEGGLFYTMALEVPEPRSAALLGAGLVAAAALRRFMRG